MPVDGDCFRVAVRFEMPDAQIAMNVFAYRLRDQASENPTNSAIIAALDTKLTEMYTNLLTLIGNAVSISYADVDRVEWDPIGEKWETVENTGRVSLALNGTNAGDIVPHGVAGVLTGYTTAPRSRARKFIPGLHEGNVVESTVDGPLLTALLEFAVDWLAEQTVGVAAKLEPRILCVKGPLKGLTRQLYSIVVNQIVGYQRRRKPGVGA